MAAVQRVRGVACERKGPEDYEWRVCGMPWEWHRKNGPYLKRFGVIILGPQTEGVWCLYDAVLFSQGYEAGARGQKLEVLPG